MASFQTRPTSPRTKEIMAGLAVSLAVVRIEIPQREAVVMRGTIQLTKKCRQFILVASSCRRHVGVYIV